MKTQTITPSFFEGQVSLEETDSGLCPWRLPIDHYDLFPSPGNTLWEKAGDAAGIRIRLATSSSAVGLRITPAENNRVFDLTMDNQIIQTVTLPDNETDILFESLPKNDKTVEIWLPQLAPVIVESILLNDGNEAAAVKDCRPHWVTYGSSITHCRQAHSPARTWPATAARMKNVHLTCLGFGGDCHIEPMIASTIATLRADLISLKIGINVQGGPSLGQRTFMASVIGFIKIIREQHPAIPIAAVSPIISPPRETEPNSAGYTLPMMREEIKEAVDRISRSCGDSALKYVNGLELFDRQWVAEMMPDELHPNGDGYEAMGERAANIIIDPLLG